MIIIVMMMIIIMIFIIIIVIITQPLVGSLFPVAIWLADSFGSLLPCMRTSPAQPLARLTRPTAWGNFPGPPMLSGASTATGLCNLVGR